MKKGLACGIFDLFHAGHVLMLQECRQNCDYLIVGLNSGIEIDETINHGKQKPVFSLAHRKLILESCRFVDKVVVYNNENELVEILKTEQPNIRFLGEDYRNKPITGEGLVNELYYIQRDHGMSTSGYKRMVREGKSEE